MLNEKLYCAIKAVFGETPKIVNEGSPATLYDVYPRFSFTQQVQNLSTKQTKGGEQYVVNCPFCGDTNHHLYISYLWDSVFTIEGCEFHASEYLFNCFRRQCTQVENYATQIINALREAMGSATLLDFSNAEIEDSSGSIANQVPYPTGVVDLMYAPDYVKHYINARGFDLQELNDVFNVRYIPFFGKFQHGLLVLPVVQNDEYYFWQGRLVPLDGTINGPLETNSEGEEYPKYYIPYGAKKGWALGNIDLASLHGTVYIVEGLFDVYAIGKQAICKFGRDMSRAQQNILQAKCRNKNIVLVPDMNDPKALPAAEVDKIALEVTGAFKSVKIAKLPDGMDPGMLKEKGMNVCEILNASIDLPDVNTMSVFGTPEWT